MDCAISCVLPDELKPMPMSTNCLTPASEMKYLIARWWKARTAGAIAQMTGADRAAACTALRSASKLSEPPPSTSQKRAAFGTLVSICPAFALRVSSWSQSSATRTHPLCCLAHCLAAERPPVDLGGDSAPVKVGCDAAEVEWPPGPKNHAQVYVLDGGDDALVEHDPDLLGEPLEGTLENLGTGGRAVAAGQQGDDVRVHREVREVHRGLARLDERAELAGDGEPVGEGGREGLRDVQRDRRADELKQQER